MSNAQWEVVGKSKKAASNGKVKLNKEEKKKVIENAPKIEDILPLAQVKSLYNALEAAEEKKLKPKSGKENKSKEADKKPQQKKPAEKKSSEPPKPKPPKSLEAALNLINLEEFSALVETSQVRFASAPLVWLKEIACFLNSKTAVDHSDVLFSSQPVTYPASIVPPLLKRKLETTISNAGKLNAQLFYDVSLTTLANDMSKGLPVIGHKILLQIIGQENPEFSVASVAKCNSLRNSYQNRPPIGLSLLWAFGQGGYKDLNVGLQVWEELILPLVEFKHYSRYVINYLSKLLDTHLKKTGSKLSQEQFLHLHDLINAKRTSLSKDLAADLVKQLPKIRTLYFEKNTGVRFQVSFNQLMKKLPNQYNNGKNYEPFQKEVLLALVNCMERDEGSFATWKQLYSRCPKQTATLLHYINANWTTVSKNIKVKSLKSLALSFLSANSEQGKKKDETALILEKQCQAVLDNMKSSRSFPWLLASFFVFLAIIGVVVFDFTQSGGVFAKSKTGQALHNIGALECTQKAWQRSIATSARGYVWLENNVPVYWQSAREFSEPYAQLAYDLGLIGFKITRGYYNNVKDYLVEKGPVVYDTVESYAPGMLASIQSFACSSWDTIKKLTVYYYQTSIDYLTANVFIGEWAPEILQDKTLKALNSTRIYVLESYNWFHKQVDIYSKIE